MVFFFLNESRANMSLISNLSLKKNHLAGSERLLKAFKVVSPVRERTWKKAKNIFFHAEP